jgi:hypothetical protein
MTGRSRKKGLKNKKLTETGFFIKLDYLRRKKAETTWLRLVCAQPKLQIGR